VEVTSPYTNEKLNMEHVAIIYTGKSWYVLALGSQIGGTNAGESQSVPGASNTSV
jgi:hypothetical protein